MSESSLRGLALLPHVRRLIELALDEDLGRGDVTTAATVGHADTRAVAVMNARVPLTVFGLDVAAAVFALVDPRIAVECHVVDGARVAGGRTPLLTARGPAAEILMAERTALNFVQRLSGVATLASRYAAEVEGTPCRVVDTRKTTPGYRVLEKAAVAACALAEARQRHGGESDGERLPEVERGHGADREAEQADRDEDRREVQAEDGRPEDRIPEVEPHHAPRHARVEREVERPIRERRVAEQARDAEEERHGDRGEGALLGATHGATLAHGARLRPWTGPEEGGSASAASRQPR